MSSSPAVADLESALRALAAGRVVGVPTDTVYGLAVDPFVAGATARLFATKRRPRRVDLPVLVADDEQAAALAASLPASARRLMDRFWPGALTIVVARRRDLAVDLGGDGTTIGLRRPDHAVAAALCAARGPLATTSANLHGGRPATTAAQVAALDGVDVVIDAGACPLHPSTVVACLDGPPALLRQGAVAWADVLAAATG